MRYPMNDVVVVLPGIMGSTLHKNGKPVWEPSAGGVIGNLRGLFKGLNSLKLPEAMGTGIRTTVSRPKPCCRTSGSARPVDLRRATPASSRSSRRRSS